MTSQGQSTGWGKAGAALLTLVVAICLAMSLPALAAAATGSIAGTVTDATTAEPLEGVEVCASPEDEEGLSPCSYTETDGTYAIGGPPSGSYKVWFWAGSQYQFEYYDGKHEWSEADPVEVLGGEQTAGIDASLERTAAIEGTVTASDDGLGVEEVEVCAYPVDPEEGTFLECGETDADGNYAIGGLSPGGYAIEFWTGWTSRPLAYEFWDNRSRFTEADTIDLAADEHREGIDAQLEPGASISGNVSDRSVGPLEGVRVCAIDAGLGTLTICTRSDEAGDYRMRSLPAGIYKVVFSLEFFEFFPGEASPGEDDDGYPTQFWDNQTTLAAANTIALSSGGAITGVDAHFGTAPQPVTVVPPASKPVQKIRRCRRGYKKKLVHGKRRCVKVRKHRHHRHKRHHRASQSRFLVN